MLSRLKISRIQRQPRSLGSRTKARRRVYVDHAGTTHGFINEDNRFETVDAPNTAFTQLLGINNQEQEAGYSSVDPAGLVNQRAFVNNENDGTFNYLTLPTNVNSQATSINDH